MIMKTFDYLRDKTTIYRSQNLNVTIYDNVWYLGYIENNFFVGESGIGSGSCEIAYSSFG